MPNKKNFNFKIGADPEFVLTMQGRKVDAKQTMQLILSTKKEFERTSDGFNIKPYGNLGWDGASATAEIRPNPSINPQEVTNNIGGILKTFTKHIKLCDMSVISEYSPVGGHIHLEIPKGEKWSTEKTNKIHKRLASFYLPILIAENKINLNLRIKQNYGSLKDYRFEQRFVYPDKTPGYTFEFRCPSAEWLTTPKLANATLAYMAVVYHEIINHPKKFEKYDDIIYKNEKQGEALQTLAIMEFKLLTESILSKAKKYVRQFEMYEQYKTEIEYIFNAKQVIKDKQKAKYNMTIGWNLSTKTLPKRNEILASKKKIKELAKIKDFDTLKSVVNIHYNDDKNVSLYAEALKDRVAAYNWKLKNNYFIFGIRKGIKTLIAKNMKDKYLTGKEILKTELDLIEMNRLFNKMAQKFNGMNNGAIKKPTLDFTTGKIKDEREEIIMIGIPYEMRIEENIKDYLKFIWTIEKGEKKTKKEKRIELKDDTNLPFSEKGEIYKILTKQTEAEDKIILDNGSYRSNENTAAMDSLIRETMMRLE